MNSGTAMKLDAQTAAELMSASPVSIRAKAGVAEAIAFLAKKGIGACPVIDEAGHPIGVVSRSDLMIHQREQAKAAAGKPEYFFAPTFGIDLTGENGDPVNAEATVADLMTPAVFAVAPETPASRVISDMLGLQVHRLFVVDAAGVLVGVISTMDVLKHLKSAV